jgi:transcriptional regulator with XRE-family HTH domain
MKKSAEVREKETQNGFTSRVKFLLESDGGNLRAFARKAGLPTPTVRRYLQGTEATVSNLVALATSANVSVEWLATGTGPIRSSVRQDIDPELSKEISVRLKEALLDSGGIDVAATTIGMPIERLREIEKTGILSLNEFAQICERLDIPADWLLAERGFALLDRYRVQKFVFEFLRSIEVIARNRKNTGLVGGGDGLNWEVRGMHALLGFWRRTFEAIAPGFYICKTPDDDTMAPTLRRGDIVIVQLETEPITPSVYLFRKSGKLFFARTTGAGRFLALSFDSNNLIENAPHSYIQATEEYTCIGKVVFVFGPPRENKFAVQSR